MVRVVAAADAGALIASYCVYRAAVYGDGIARTLESASDASGVSSSLCKHLAAVDGDLAA